MRGEHYPSIPDEEWKQFSENAETELLPTYQEEAIRRFHDLNDYIRSAPDALPNKEVVLKITAVLAEALTAHGELSGNTPEQTRAEFVSELSAVLHEWGYTTTTEQRLAYLETSDDTMQNALQSGHFPDWLSVHSAAVKELQRLRSWAQPHVIRDDREGAEATMELIYSRFPDLRPPVNGGQ
jgi:hypothetical protein